MKPISIQRTGGKTGGCASKPVEPLRGWLGYFADGQTPSELRDFETWLRRRLRSVVWKQWKRGRTRFRELGQRGVRQDLAAKTARSPHGPWRLANSPALERCLAQCLLRCTRASEHSVYGFNVIRRTAGCGPACRWCGRGEWATTSPMPICLSKRRRYSSVNIVTKPGGCGIFQKRLAEHGPTRSEH